LLALPRHDWLRISVLGLIGNTFYQLLFITGMNHTTPANSSLLMATSPIWVAVISYALRIERINRAMWGGIVLSFLGIAVLVLGGNEQLSLAGGTTWLGDLMLLGCAIVWAIYTSISKPFLGRYSPLKLTTWTMITGTIPLALLSLPAILRQDWRAISEVGWGALLFSALLAVVVGYLVWYTSVQRVGNTRTAIYSNVTPIFAIAFAWLLLGSALTWPQGVGATVVLLGLTLTRRGRVK
jgi:drug/metabolite transporter (DMT)-like permease